MHYYLDKTKNEIIQELMGWDSPQAWRDALDRTGQLSERQTYLDNLPSSEIEQITQTEAEALSSVPQSITARQARLALNQAGLRQQVEDAIANSNDQDLKDEWEYAQYIERKWPALIALTTGLGMTRQQLDNLFILGATL